MTDYLERRELMQRLNDRSYPMEEQYKRDNLALLIALCAIALSLGSYMRSCVREPQPAANVIEKPNENCVKCHDGEAKMKAYFEKNGSPKPKEMAHAILRTNSPKLMAAIAVVETGGNSSIKNSGYKKRHDGAFQVNPKHWGKVPKDAVGQALQAERILEDLQETMPLKKALAMYGGDSTGKYSRKILAELTRVP